jgi:hypothetical protein
MIKEFIIKENITDYLIFVLDKLKNNNIGIELNSCCTINGFQTNNINEVPCMQNTLNNILEYLPVKDLKYRWFHLIDYDKNGSQNAHDHKKTEDFSYILYLTDCENGGETMFYEDKNITTIKPQKNKLIFFDANLWHEGNATIDHKKVAVGALIKV